MTFPLFHEGRITKQGNMLNTFFRKKKKKKKAWNRGNVKHVKFFGVNGPISPDRCNILNIFNISPVLSTFRKEHFTFACFAKVESRSFCSKSAWNRGNVKYVKFFGSKGPISPHRFNWFVLSSSTPLLIYLSVSVSLSLVKLNLSISASLPLSLSLPPLLSFVFSLLSLFLSLLVAPQSFFVIFLSDAIRLGGWFFKRETKRGRDR